MLVWALALFVFLADRGLFLRTAHHAAALLMFVCIVVVVNNARDSHDEEQVDGRRRALDYSRLYLVIAVLMALGTGAACLYNWRFGWDHWLLFVESALIILFGVFWSVQTRELWYDGIRR